MIRPEQNTKRTRRLQRLIGQGAGVPLPLDVRLQHLVRVPLQDFRHLLFLYMLVCIVCYFCFGVGKSLSV